MNKSTGMKCPTTHSTGKECAGCPECAPNKLQLADALIAAFESIQHGAREPLWTEWQNGDGENVGMRIEAARKAYYAAPVEAQPVSGDLHEQISKALSLAMTICDATPNRAHLCDDATLAHIGELVNGPQGRPSGYSAIRDAEAAWKLVATQPAAVPADAEIPPLPRGKMLSGMDLESLHVLYSVEQMRERDAMWSARVRAALASHSAVPVAQGEPVAYADPQAFRNFKAGTATKEWMWAKPDAGLIGIFTAPVAPKEAQPIQAVPAGWTIKAHEDGMVFFKRPDEMRRTVAAGEPIGSYGETLHMLMSALAAAPTPGAAK